MTHLVLLGLMLLITAPLASGAPKAPYKLQNTTISLPEGTSNHGDPELLCVPSRWTDVAKFFIANIVAHAATVQASPGEPLVRGGLAMLLAIIFPSSGVARGFDAILRHAIKGSTPVQQAKRLEHCAKLFELRTGNRAPVTLFGEFYWRTICIRKALSLQQNLDPLSTARKY